MNNVITLDQAIQMTTLFREQRAGLLRPDLADKNILLTSETFDRAAFDQILSQPGCTGLRVYYGMKEDLQLRAIIVGVNANNEDLLPSNAGTTGAEPAGTMADSALIAEDGITCPPICAPSSPLNP